MVRQYYGDVLTATTGKSKMAACGVNDYLRTNDIRLMTKHMCIGTTVSAITYCDPMSGFGKD
jgi:hypothetical protein